MVLCPEEPYNSILWRSTRRQHWYGFFEKVFKQMVDMIFQLEQLVPLSYLTDLHSHIRSGIYTVSALDGIEKNSFSVQFHLLVQRWPTYYPWIIQTLMGQMFHVELDQKTSFLDLNIKVIGSDVHTNVYDKRDDFGFLIVNFPWLSGDVPRIPSYGVNISQLVRFARCCTSVSDFHFKNLQITSKLLTQAYRYHKLRKTFGKFFRSYSDLLSNLVKYRFKNMFRKESLTLSSTVI